MNAEQERYLLSKERGFLATVGADGTPTVVPVCFAYEGGMIYTAVDAKPKSANLARVRNVRKSGHAALVVDTYSKDWKRLSYLLVHGRAEIVTDLGERRRALKLLVGRFPQYRWLGGGFGEVIKIRVQRTKLWRFGGRRPTRSSLQV